MLRALHALIVSEVFVLVALQQLARESFLRILFRIAGYACALAGLVSLRNGILWTGLAGTRLCIVVFCSAARHGLAVKIAVATIGVGETLTTSAFANIPARRL